MHHLAVRRLFTLIALTLFPSVMAQASPLRIGYSDWPGYVAWQVAIDKDWFKEAGVDAQFQWFDYSASLDAFSAGKLDGVTTTNGDALVTGGNGARNVIVAVTDYSNGNDMIVGRPGIRSLAELKGKKIGIEIGLVDHLLLLNGLKKAGIAESDITLVNTPTNETPQVLASGDVAAIGAFQPNSGMALRQVPGSRPIYTSADQPGLIYDVLTVSPASLNGRRADWAKLLKVWYRCVDYIHDPKTVDDAVRIMSARVGLTPELYKPLLAGTYLLSLAEAKKAYTRGDGFESIYGSTRIADAFNVQFAIYKQKQDVDSYIDPSLTEAQ